MCCLFCLLAVNKSGHIYLLAVNKSGHIYLLTVNKNSAFCLRKVRGVLFD